MPSTRSGRQRVVSISSMRRRKRPPCCAANRAFSSAEYAWPRCSRPVGDGAKRVTTPGFGEAGEGGTGGGGTVDGMAAVLNRGRDARKPHMEGIKSLVLFFTY